MVDLNEIATFEKVLELINKPYDEKEDITVSKQKIKSNPEVVSMIQQVNKKTINLVNKPKDFHYEMELI